MERLGLPTASIITHVFNNTAKAMTRMMGVPDFEYIAVSYTHLRAHETLR